MEEDVIGGYSIKYLFKKISYYIWYVVYKLFSKTRTKTLCKAQRNILSLRLTKIN